MHLSLRIVERFGNGVVNLQRAILMLVTVFVFCTMSAGIISRYVVGLPLWGMDELSGHTAVWLYLIGAAYGTYTRGHIKAELVQMVIRNPRALAIVRLVTVVLSAVVAGYMTLWSYGYLYESITRHERMQALRWPTALFQVPILIGAILMFIYFVAEAIDLFREASARGSHQRRESCYH